MVLPGAILGLLAMATILLPRGGCAGSPSHSLRYYYLEVSEPSHGLTQFFVRKYLDDQPIARYDRDTKKMEPLVSWMEKEEKEEDFLGLGWVFKTELDNLSRHNQPTEELHTWQAILGCEDGNKGGVFRYGYNGIDFITFENETWIVNQSQGKKVEDKWKDNPVLLPIKKESLEKTCIGWLKKYLSYRKEAHTEPPVGKVTHTKVNDSLEVLICQAFGFYPKEIEATWKRDGEVCKYESLHRNVAPNSDGTYYLRLSIEIDPKERGCFQCHLEHKGLQELLVLSFKEKTGWQILVGIVVGVLLELGIRGVMFGLVILFLICRWCWRRRRSHYQKTKSLHDDFLLKVLSSSPTSGREEDERLLELPPQSKITLDDRASSGGWSPQRALEDSASTFRRRQGKLPPRKKSNSWSEPLGKAGATESEEMEREWPEAEVVTKSSSATYKQ